MSSYYRILGVSRFADREQIRRAFWSLTRRFRAGLASAEDAARLAQIQRAYRVLSDSPRRRSYGAGEGEAASPGTGTDLPIRRIDATEVAPGFPSMLDVVPRMLRTFFDKAEGARVAHTADVALTPREALEGARVPMEIPIRPSCPMCGGRGESWAEPCRICDGTGSGRLSHQLHFRVPPGVRHGARLTFSVSPPFSPQTQVELRIAVQ